MRSPFGTLSGMRVVETPAAVEKIRNFKSSRYRSKRVHKKLCQRHGGEFWHKPAAFRAGGVLYAHPDVVRELQRRCAP